MLLVLFAGELVDVLGLIADDAPGLNVLARKGDLKLLLAAEAGDGVMDEVDCDCECGRGIACVLIRGN